MNTVNPLDPAAPPFTPIDLSSVIRPFAWIDEPTPAEVEQAVIQSLARVAALCEDLAPPALQYHLVHIYGARATTYGREAGYDIAKVRTCPHGGFPTLVMTCTCCEDGHRFEYVDEQGAYYPVSA